MHYVFSIIMAVFAGAMLAYAGLMAVTKEEYNDACQILSADGGVVKGAGGNKMNEIRPHTNWAKKVYSRARAFGVVANESGYVKLFAVNER